MHNQFTNYWASMKHFYTFLVWINLLSIPSFPMHNPIQPLTLSISVLLSYHMCSYIYTKWSFHTPYNLADILLLAHHLPHPPSPYPCLIKHFQSLYSFFSTFVLILFYFASPPSCAPSHNGSFLVSSPPYVL